MTNFERQRQELEKWGIGCFDDVPKNVTDYLRNNISKEIPKQESLAGHLKDEYGYKNWPLYVEEYLMKCVSQRNYLLEYAKTIKALDIDVPFYLGDMWVNLQRKHEFNPIHTHSGVWSFIIPLQVPYKLEDEDKVFPSQGNRKSCTSKLCFVVNNNVGQINSVEVDMDQSYVDKLLIFPAKLNHLVYPFFTSDGIRITVSGNISLRASEPITKDSELKEIKT